MVVMAADGYGIGRTGYVVRQQREAGETESSRR